MKKLLFLATSLFAAFAFAGTTLIQADLRCEQQGGGLAIKMPTQTTSARVWQSDVGETDGLELKVTKFEVYRCAQCFQFEAVLFGASVRGKVTSGVLNYEIYGEDTKEWIGLLNGVRCVAATLTR